MTTALDTRWHGPVHEFHSPATVTASNGGSTRGCGNVENGVKCGQPESSMVHKFVASSSCNWPIAKVEVYVGGPSYVHKTHYATFAWQSENEGSWFSGWYSAHNDPGVWRRCPKLDCKSGQQVGMFVAGAASHDFTVDGLKEMEVSNQ